MLRAPPTLPHGNGKTPDQALQLTDENRRLQSYKGSQLFVGVHNETFSILAMRIGNESLCAH
jgi:hypothetical protein